MDPEGERQEREEVPHAAEIALPVGGVAPEEKDQEECHERDAEKGGRIEPLRAGVLDSLDLADDIARVGLSLAHQHGSLGNPRVEHRDLSRRLVHAPARFADSRTRRLASSRSMIRDWSRRLTSSDTPR